LGQFEWKGAWGDDSSEWTEELKKKVGFVKNDNDGLFWMAYDDFIQYYSRIQICKYKDQCQFYSKEYKFEEYGYYFV